MSSFLHIKNKYYTQLLPLGIIFFLGVATLLTFIISQKRQDIRSKALTQNAVLSFSPSSVSVNANATFNVSVILNTTAQAALGADILVHFDKNKLSLTTIAKGTNGTFKTFAPITDQTTGNFDVSRVISCANTGAFNADTTKCPSGAGVVEFGIVAFDWAAVSASPLPSPFAGVMSPVATLTFQVKSGISGTADILEFIHVDNPKFQNGVWTATTDSNVVANPTGTGNPEDILAVPTSTVAVTITSTGGSPSPTPTTSPTPSPSSSVNPSPSASPSVSPSTSPSVSPTPTPSSSPNTSPSPTASPTNIASLLLQVGLEGVAPPFNNYTPPAQNMKVVFKNTAGQIIASRDPVHFEPNSSGVYRNFNDLITGIPLTGNSETVNICVTQPYYLNKCYNNKVIYPGSNTIDVSTDFLFAGDAINAGSSSNVVDYFDFNNIFNNFGCNSSAGATPPPNKACNSFKSDFDLDGDVDLYDYNYMMGNYGATGN